MLERTRELAITRESRYIPVGQDRIWLQSSNLQNPGLDVIGVPGGPGFGILEVLQFANTGFPTHLAELRGIGHARPDNQTPEDLDRISTVSAFVEQIGAVQDAIGVEKSIIMGHSSGGTFAMIYALRYPKRVAGLILVGPMLSGKRADIDGRRLAEKMKPGLVERILQIEAAGQTDSEEYKEYQAEFEERFLFGERLLENFPQNLIDSEKRANLEIYKRMVGESEIVPDMTKPLLKIELTGRLHEIAHIPTLFIGGRDDLITPETLEIMHAAMDGSEHVVMEDSSHFPHESQPVEFQNKVVDFINRRILSQAA